jgi:hypothetical protein
MIKETHYSGSTVIGWRVIRDEPDKICEKTYDEKAARQEFDNIAVNHRDMEPRQLAFQLTNYLSRLQEAIRKGCV